MNNKNDYINFGDIVSFIKQLFSFAINKWKQLVLAGLIGGVLGFTFAWLKKPDYNAKLSFIINENEPAGSLNLSSLAGLAGLAGMGGNTNVNEDKMIFLANSRSLLGETFLTEGVVNNKKDLLINHFIVTYELEKKFASDTALKNFTSFTHKNIQDLTYQENKALDKILKQILDSKLYTIEVRKKAGIVAQWAGIVILELKTKNEELSKLFIDNLYQNLSLYYTNKTIRKQLQNYTLIKKRADSISTILYTKEEYGAEAFDRTARTTKMLGKLDVQRSRRDIEMLSLMYGEVLKNVEMAKFALDNQTPVFQIIDTPTYPLEIKKLSKLLTAIALSFITAFLTFMFLYYKNHMSKIAKPS